MRAGYSPKIAWDEKYRAHDTDGRDGQKNRSRNKRSNTKCHQYMPRTLHPWHGKSTGCCRQTPITHAPRYAVMAFRGLFIARHRHFVAVCLVGTIPVRCPPFAHETIAGFKYSAPLSQRMAAGLPRHGSICSSLRSTRSAGNEKSTCIPNASRVKSSITLNTRMLRPPFVKRRRMDARFPT